MLTEPSSLGRVKCNLKRFYCLRCGHPEPSVVIFGNSFYSIQICVQCYWSQLLKFVAYFLNSDCFCMYHMGWDLGSLLVSAYHFGNVQEIVWQRSVLKMHIEDIQHCICCVRPYPVFVKELSKFTPKLCWRTPAEIVLSGHGDNVQHSHYLRGKLIQQ
jgi:hypothetical protein